MIRIIACPLLAFLAALAGMIGLVACSPQTSGGKGSVVTGSSKEIGEDGGSVEIDNGSVTIPPGALAAGTDVNLTKTDQPSEFNFESIAAASQPISISATGSDGTALSSTNQPLTIALDLDGSSLSLAEASEDNLCVFLKATAGLYVWRRAAITVSSRTAEIKTTRFGIFQVVYCGSDDLPGFNDAAVAGISGAEKDLTINVTIPSTFADYGHSKICAFLSFLEESECEEGGSNGDCGHDSGVVLASNLADPTKATDQTLALSYSSQQLVSGSGEYVSGFYLLGAGASCPFQSGDEFDMDKASNHLAFFAFLHEANEITTGFDTTFGSGRYLTQDVSFATDDNGVGAAPTAETACLTVSVEGGHTAFAISIAAAGTVNGSPVASFPAAVGADASQPQIKVVVGTGCVSLDDEPDVADPATAKPYLLEIEDADLNSTHEITATQFLLDTSYLSAAHPGAKACLVATVPEPNDGEEIIGSFLVDLAVPTYNVYLPYLPNSGTNMNFDATLKILSSNATSCRDDSDLSLPATAETLAPTINIP